MLMMYLPEYEKFQPESDLGWRGKIYYICRKIYEIQIKFRSSVVNS